MLRDRIARAHETTDTVRAARPSWLVHGTAPRLMPGTELVASSLQETPLVHVGKPQQQKHHNVDN